MARHAWAAAAPAGCSWRRTLSAVWLCGVASVACAGTLTGSLGIDSDDAFRGLSQNDGQASVQGDLHDSASQWYAGACAELVRRGVAASRGAELIGYLAWQRANCSEPWPSPDTRTE